MLRCVTPHTPLTLPQRCCRLCGQKPTHQGQRRFPAHLPKRGTSLRKGWAATTPAKEPDRSSPGRRYPARRTARKPPERLDHWKHWLCRSQTRLKNVRRGNHQKTLSRFVFAVSASCSSPLTNILRFRLRIVWIGIGRRQFQPKWEGSVITSGHIYSQGN